MVSVAFVPFAVIMMVIRNTMKKLIASLTVLSVVALPVLAGAAAVQVGQNYSQTKGEVVSGNLYAAAGNLVFAGDTKGDLVAAGGEVTLKGSVGKDLLLAGGTLTLDGVIGDDARVAGGDVTISGTIKGDLVVAGGNFHLLTGATVGGDLLVAGGTVTIDGAVAHDIRIAGGQATLNGAVGGNVMSRSEHLVLGATAVVAGDLTSTAAQEAVIDPAAVVKGKTINTLSLEQHDFRNLVQAAGVVGFVMFIVAGLVCFWLFKNRSRQLVAHALAHLGKEFLRGILLLILLPILFIALCITLVGAPIGIMGILFYVIIVMLAKVFAGIMLGGWINKVVFKKPDQVFTWQTVIGGNVVLFALRFVPVLGGLVQFIFTVVAFGAFWGYLYRHFWVNR